MELKLEMILMWVLGPEPGPPARTVSTLSSISPAPELLSFKSALIKSWFRVWTLAVPEPGERRTAMRLTSDSTAEWDPFTKKERANKRKTVGLKLITLLSVRQMSCTILLALTTSVFLLAFLFCYSFLFVPLTHWFMHSFGEGLMCHWLTSNLVQSCRMTLSF